MHSDMHFSRPVLLFREPMDVSLLFLPDSYWFLCGENPGFLDRFYFLHHQSIIIKNIWQDWRTRLGLPGPCHYLNLNERMAWWPTPTDSREPSSSFPTHAAGSGGRWTCTSKLKASPSQPTFLPPPPWKSKEKKRPRKHFPTFNWVLELNERIIGFRHICQTHTEREPIPHFLAGPFSLTSQTNIFFRRESRTCGPSGGGAGQRKLGSSFHFSPFLNLIFLRSNDAADNFSSFPCKKMPKKNWH